MYQIDCRPERGRGTVYLVRKEPIAAASASKRAGRYCVPQMDSTYIPKHSHVSVFDCRFILSLRDRSDGDDMVIVPSNGLSQIPADVELWIDSDFIAPGRLIRVRTVRSGTWFRVEPIALPFEIPGAAA
jgi:hypothetical protein